MIRALADGLATARRSWGLAVLLLAANLCLALLLAVPFYRVLERDLGTTDAAAGMMYGFDYRWWSHWSDSQSGWTSSFGPDIVGTGFAFKNVDALLHGQLPARLFAEEPNGGDEEREGAERLDPVVLGLGVVYLVLQTFLTGGVLGVLRAPQGGWTLRGLLHGSGFYFGRFARVALLALTADAVIFGLDVPLRAFVDHRALESVSERSALCWSFGHYAALLLALLFVHMVSCYAKVITVVEQRSSAVLALLSALAFCLGNLRRTAGHYLSVAALAVGLLVLWALVDGAFPTVGYKTQLVALLLAQALVFGRIFLRLSLLGGQLSLYRGSQAQ